MHINVSTAAFFFVYGTIFHIYAIILNNNSLYSHFCYYKGRDATNILAHAFLCIWLILRMALRPINKNAWSP